MQPGRTAQSRVAHPRNIVSTAACRRLAIAAPVSGSNSPVRHHMPVRVSTHVRNDAFDHPFRLPHRHSLRFRHAALGERGHERESADDGRLPTVEPCPHPGDVGQRRGEHRSVGVARVDSSDPLLELHDGRPIHAPDPTEGLSQSFPAVSTARCASGNDGASGRASRRAARRSRRWPGASAARHARCGGSASSASAPAAARPGSSRGSTSSRG